MVIRFGRQPPAASHAIVPGDDAVLDRLFAASRLAHPGQSGVRLVSAGIEAFALRALSARAATRSLDLQYYIWHDDATGRYLASEALAAADRGVRVRLLLDDMDARQRDDVLIALDQHPYIEVRLFNPFRTRSGLLRTLGEVFSRGSRLNHRMHNKAWIADGRLALVGGRNIGDEYFSASDGVNFVDLDVLLAGDAVDATASSFDAYWNSGSSMPIARLRSARRKRMSLLQLRGVLAESVRAQANEHYTSQLRQSPEIGCLIHGDYALLWGQQVEVVVDDPRKAIKHAADLGPGVLDSLRQAFRATQRQLLLISPYFVPGAGGVGGLTGLVEAGKQVGVLTNSLAATDVAAVHSGYVRYREALLRGGVRIYELKPAPEALEHEKMRLRFGSSRASLHTKAAIVDGEHAFVGSFNLDPRSATLNCEMGVWIRSQVLAQQLGELFAEGASPQHSFAVQLDERGRTRWTESVHGRTVEYRRDPYASWGRRVAVWLLKFLPIESQL